MKKNIIIFSAVIITLSLTAFGMINTSNTEKPLHVEAKETTTVTTSENSTVTVPKVFTDFIYDVGPRFRAIKREDVMLATSLNDFLSEKETRSIEELKFVYISIFEKNQQRSGIQEISYTKDLTEAQLKLLKSLDYSTNFLIRAEYLVRNKITDRLESNYANPHLTIVPEKQATYSNGKDALKKFLKENSLDARNKANVDPEKLQPAKLFFTVTKNGTIENIRLDRSSKYPLVDETMIELIQNAPGTWSPAENHKGEKVNQELVVSFGLMGC